MEEGRVEGQTEKREKKNCPKKKRKSLCRKEKLFSCALWTLR